MPILNIEDVNEEEMSPGTRRWAIVDGTKGADSLSIGDLTLAPGSKVTNHIHPTEEAMVILEGELDAVLGDDVVKVGPGQTVLAPPGVRHGFVNNSGAPARLMAIFPTATIERTFVD